VEDLIGIEYAKLGFFREVQEKIGELHASNIELMRRKHHIQAILRGITDVMAVLSLDLRISSVNEVFHEVFGAEHPEGQYCYQVFRQREEPCPGCVALKARDTNSIFRELVITPVNGKNHHFEITASPLRNGDGVPCHILVVKRDVTLEKEYQAKYLQAEKMATVGFLAAGVAHEINNPLGSVLLYADILCRDTPADDNQRREDLQMIVKEATRCKTIVTDLLNFSRQNRVLAQKTDLAALLQTMIAEVSQKPSYARISLSAEIDPALPEIEADPLQLHQALLNLMNNAVDAMPAGGSLILRARQGPHPGFVTIQVQDTGTGITKENMSKLFTPFFTTKPIGTGTGLGLAITYGIVKMHQGQIAVQSVVGEGTTFTITLREKLPSPEVSQMLSS